MLSKSGALPSVSQLIALLMENERKRTLTAVLATYLRRDRPAGEELEWTCLHPWMRSMSPLHITARLGLADQAPGAHRAGPVHVVLDRCLVVLASLLSRVGRLRGRCSRPAPL